MSTNDGRPIVSGNALIWAIAAMFIAVVAACVALAIGLPESQNAAGLAAQLLTAFAGLVASLGALFGISKVRERVDRIASDVNAVRNGEMEGKLQAVLEAHEQAKEG